MEKKEENKTKKEIKKETKPKQAVSKKKQTNNKEEKKKNMIVICVFIAVAIISIITIGVIVYIIDSHKIETRLSPNPSNYYSETNNYFIYNNKIYYYSIDTQDRGRVYSMDFDGKNNELVSSSEVLKTPKFLYAYENKAYCECPYTTTTDTIFIEVDLFQGTMRQIDESELPIESNNEVSQYEDIIKEIGYNKEVTKVTEVDDKLVIDYDCNKVSKYDLNGIAIYDTKTKKHETYSDIRHYDIDRDNNIVYILDKDYNVKTINL